MTVVDDLIVLVDDTDTDAATIDGDAIAGNEPAMRADNALVHGPALPTEPLIGARAAARAARRRRPRTEEAGAADVTAAASVQWSSTSTATDAEQTSDAVATSAQPVSADALLLANDTDLAAATTAEANDASHASRPA